MDDALTLLLFRYSLDLLYAAGNPAGDLGSARAAAHLLGGLHIYSRLEAKNVQSDTNPARRSVPGTALGGQEGDAALITGIVIAARRPAPGRRVQQGALSAARVTTQVSELCTSCSSRAGGRRS